MTVQLKSPYAYPVAAIETRYFDISRKTNHTTKEPLFSKDNVPLYVITVTSPDGAFKVTVPLASEPNFLPSQKITFIDLQIGSFKGNLWLRASDVVVE